MQICLDSLEAFFFKSVVWLKDEGQTDLRDVLEGYELIWHS